MERLAKSLNMRTATLKKAMSKREVISRFGPPVLEQLNSGVSRRASVLFADICGFTRTADKLHDDPRAIAEMLNIH